VAHTGGDGAILHKNRPLNFIASAASVVPTGPRARLPPDHRPRNAIKVAPLRAACARSELLTIEDGQSECLGEREGPPFVINTGDNFMLVLRESPQVMSQVIFFRMYKEYH
jgi:hypothetical protein